MVSLRTDMHRYKLDTATGEIVMGYHTEPWRHRNRYSVAGFLYLYWNKQMAFENEN